MVAVNAPSEIRIRLAAEVVEAAERMLGTEPVAEVNLVPLGRLLRWVDRVLPTAKESSDRCVLLFLSLFLHDVFFNLTGDVVYDPDTEEKRRAFFGSLAGDLRRMGTRLADATGQELMTSWEDLAARYLDVIDSLS